MVFLQMTMRVRAFSGHICAHHRLHCTALSENSRGQEGDYSLCHDAGRTKSLAQGIDLHYFVTVDTLALHHSRVQCMYGPTWSNMSKHFTFEIGLSRTQTHWQLVICRPCTFSRSSHLLASRLCRLGCGRGPKLPKAAALRASSRKSIV